MKADACGTYTLKEVLERVGLSYHGYYALLHAGRWPFTPLRPKLGARERYSKAQIDAYLQGEPLDMRPVTRPQDLASQLAYFDSETR